MKVNRVPFLGTAETVKNENKTIKRLFAGLQHRAEFSTDTPAPPRTVGLQRICTRQCWHPHCLNTRAQLELERPTLTHREPIFSPSFFNHTTRIHHRFVFVTSSLFRCWRIGNERLRVLTRFHNVFAAFSYLQSGRDSQIPRPYEIVRARHDPAGIFSFAFEVHFECAALCESHG